MSIETKILNWFFTGHVGSSSKTMAAIAVDQEEVMFGFDRPHDSSDFYRCYELVKAVPEIKDHFDKIKERCPEFGPILDRWDELCELFDADTKNSTSHCNNLIRELNDACHIAGGWQKTRFGWTKEKETKVPF